MALVLIDGENVRRSQWPNVQQDRLVELARQWADATGNDVLVVFDGRAPVDGEDVVGTGGESADDWLTRRARELAGDGQAHWLVTSDRELRARAAGDAERVVGGGAFLRELLVG